MITGEEKSILRELAKAYAELAALDVQTERRNRARDINGLVPRRPMVWINEIPWHEMDIDGQLHLKCSDAFARSMEWHFRSTLFRWRYFQTDMVVEPYFPLPKRFSSSGIGLEVAEDVLVTDKNNYIVSHGYIDQLDTEEKVEALRLPILTPDREGDTARYAQAAEILEGILPVRMQGTYIYHSPWDVIPRYRGVTPVMLDLIERPELMHKTIQKFTDIGLSQMQQMEELGLLDNQNPDLHCTPSYVPDLKPATPAKLKDIWFRGMAQMFSSISPAMHEEFDLHYMKPLFEKCGLVYYGCCEALDNKVDSLKKIPNMRKIGVSPWANPRRMAEQLGGSYVYAHKPNPAHVSARTDRETVQKEITAVIEVCLENKCPYEFVLKDISTVSYRPQNLIDWYETVKDTLDHYYA